jgi:hypothetical protein
MAKVTILLEDSDTEVRIEAFSEPPMDPDNKTPAQVLAYQIGRILTRTSDAKIIDTSGPNADN